MSNGLVAQWHRRIAGRGLVGAVLLSVPVAVAAALGFSGAFNDFGSGLRAIGSIGGESQQPAQSRPLSRVVVTPTAGSASASAAGGGADTGGGVGGALGGGGSSSGGGGGGSSGDFGGGGSAGGGGTGGGGVGDSGGGIDTGGGGGLPSVPGVDLPVGDDTGGAGSVVDGVSDTVNGLLPGRN
jgi:hypothetical protein